MILLIIFIILFVTYLFILWLFPMQDKHELSIYFGIPGSGKTTFAAYLAKKCISEDPLITFARKHEKKWYGKVILLSGLWKRRYEVYSNVPITDTYMLNAQSDIGVFDIHDAKIIIDEAGIEYNNRNYKSLDQRAVKYFKYHRHYKTSIDVFSQSYDDMDITLRRLAKNLFIVKKSLIPYFIVIKKINRRIGCDEQHQITDMYDFGLPFIDSKHVFTPPLWRMFNSYSREPLIQREWQKW